MNAPETKPGTITWVDLTVDTADATRDFYEQVIGWTNQPVEMDGYSDYCMNAASGETVAGICHARGENVGIPPVWMVYINVDDINETVARCEQNGGQIVQPARKAGGGQCAILKDPGGTVFGVYQP